MRYISGLSGGSAAAFFPRDVMPGWAQVVAELLPLTHLVDLLRGAALGSLEAAHWLDVLWLLGYAGLAAPLAVVLMRRKLVK